MLRHHLHFDRVAQVGLVCAVPQGGIFIGNLRPVLVYCLAAAELFEDACQHRLNGVKHILLCDKAHFQVELVKVGGGSVRARVFITKTGCDLKVPVKT